MISSRVIVVFSGVYDTATGKWHTQPSGTPQHPPKLANGEPVKPFVQRIGGHRDVQAELIAKGGVNGDKTVGFALVYNRDGSLTIRWNSGINQMNFQQRSVPPEFRPSSLLK
ncbi:MAG: hypothetical protein KatS3mg105_1267 [Gemmatales bacterium]|nr:MAG: hypothetical protein KatS3mg105_1267 [Gemmatales bacterium]